MRIDPNAMDDFDNPDVYTYADVLYLLVIRFGPNWKHQFSRAIARGVGRLKVSWLNDEMEVGKLYCVGYMIFEPWTCRKEGKRYHVQARGRTLTRSPFLARKRTAEQFERRFPDLARQSPYKSILKMMDRAEPNQFLMKVEHTHLFDKPFKFHETDRVSVEIGGQDEIALSVLSMMDWPWKILEHLIHGCADLVRSRVKSRSNPYYKPHRSLTEEEKSTRQSMRRLKYFGVCCFFSFFFFFFL